MVRKLVLPFCVSLLLVANACTLSITGGSGATRSNSEQGALQTLPKDAEVVSSAQINGTKFLLYSRQLAIGDSVYDTSLRQTAVVKNQIVVVTDATPSYVLADYLASYSSSVSIKPLAGATVAIYYNDANSDLLLHYQQLKTLSGIRQVEMQFDYSSKKSLSLYPSPKHLK